MKTFNSVLLTLFVLGIGATLAAENATDASITEESKLMETTIPTTLDPNITTTAFPNATTTTATTPLTTSSTTTPAPTTTTPSTTTSSTTTPSTTTASTTTTSSTTPATTTPITTTVAPSTTTPNSTTVSPETTTGTPHPAPIPHPSKWSLTSFIGGIVFGLGMIAIGFVAWKFYKARNERNYHTL